MKEKVHSRRTPGLPTTITRPTTPSIKVKPDDVVPSLPFNVQSIESPALSSPAIDLDAGSVPRDASTDSPALRPQSAQSVFYFLSLTTAPSFTQHVRCFTPPPHRSPLVLNSSFPQLPIRNRTAGIVRAKGDENATSKHLRQGSGAGVGPSRSTTFVKNVHECPVLNEITKTTINRKVMWPPSLLHGWY